MAKVGLLGPSEIRPDQGCHHPTWSVSPCILSTILQTWGEEAQRTPLLLNPVFSLDVANMSRPPRGVLCKGSSLEFRNNLFSTKPDFQNYFLALTNLVWNSKRNDCLALWSNASEHWGWGGWGMGAAGQLDLQGMKNKFRWYCQNYDFCFIYHVTFSSDLFKVHFLFIVKNSTCSF